MGLLFKRNKLRKNIIKTLESGKRAHLGSALSIVEVIRVLYDDYLNVTPKNFAKSLISYVVLVNP